jgi:hypothetical protein
LQAPFWQLQLQRPKQELQAALQSWQLQWHVRVLLQKQWQLQELQTQGPTPLVDRLTATLQAHWQSQA